MSVSPSPEVHAEVEPRARSLGRHVVAISAIAGVLAAPSLLAPLSTYDGGLVPSAGTLMLHGELPYRDFWWLYGPGGPAIVASLTSVFGPSLLLLRLIGLGFLMAQAGAAYILLRTRVNHLPAALIALASTHSEILFLGLNPTAWQLSMTFALCGVALRCAVPQRSALAGVMLAFAFLVRLDVGTYAFLAALVSANRRPLIVGFTAVVLPVAVVLLVAVPIGSLWEQLIWYPIIGPRQFRGVPGPEFQDWIVFISLPLVVVPKLAILAAAIRIALSRDRPTSFTTLVVFAALCQLQTQGRSDIHHHAQAATPGLLLLGLWVMSSPSNWRESVGRFVDNAPAGILHLGSLALVSTVCALALSSRALNLAVMEVGALGPGDAGFIAGVRTLVANTSPTDAVFVGLTSNRYTLVNPMLAYYLADRRAGVRVAMFNPGVTNVESVQREMIGNLVSTNTQILLLDHEFADAFEASNDSRIPGSTALDDFIASSYVQVCQFGDTRIFATHDRASGVVCIKPGTERLVDILFDHGLPAT